MSGYNNITRDSITLLRICSSTLYLEALSMSIATDNMLINCCLKHPITCVVQFKLNKYFTNLW